MTDYTFTSFPPSPHLQFIIKNFFVLEYDKDAKLTNYLLPDGLPSLFYVQTNEPLVAQLNNRTVQLDNGLYGGYSSTLVNLQHRQFRIVGASVFPIYFHLISNKNLSEVLNHFVRLKALESKLNITLSNQTSYSDFIMLFENHITARLNKYKVNEDFTLMYETLINSAGYTLRIEELAKQLGYSTRSLHTHFSHHFGMSPKRFMKLLRFSLALKHVYDAEKQENLSLIAHEAGYHDQSHLNRDFKSICGKTPGEIAGNVRTLASKFRLF